VIERALPVSGVRLRVRELTGADQLIVLHPRTTAPETLLVLLRAVATDGAGSEVGWEQLPAVDLAAAALALRGAWLGDRIHTDTVCPADGCSELIDVSFFVPDYLEHHGPRRFRGLERRPDGWLTFAGEPVQFRIPLIEDLVVAEREQRGEAWLRERCVRPGGAPAAMRRRIDRALSAVAPRLDDHVTGRCPACGRVVELFFSPVDYVVSELRDVSSELYADVHELALAYHWSEQSILALERRRRQSYVALVRGEAVLA
jgi:hypothetical protein